MYTLGDFFGISLLISFYNVTIFYYWRCDKRNAKDSYNCCRNLPKELPNIFSGYCIGGILMLHCNGGICILCIWDAAYWPKEYTSQYNMCGNC